METKFVVIYYNVDEVSNSEVIGIFNSKQDAVIEMIKAAHYDEKDGVLRQYREQTTDYSSYQELFEIANRDLQLIDYDIFRVEEVKYSQTN